VRKDDEPAPEGAMENVSQTFEKPVELIIALTTGINSMEMLIEARSIAYTKQIDALNKMLDEDTAPAKEQMAALKKELEAAKKYLADNWTSVNSREELDGWKLDRKERKSVQIINPLILLEKSLKFQDWPFKITWNKTKLASLMAEKVIFPGESIQPAVTVSINVTPPKNQG